MAAPVEDHPAGHRAVLAEIPAFPPIALSVLDQASRQDAELARLASTIASDAVFSAQVLRLANSPLFGHAAEITSVHHAVVTLGLDKVQGLAMTIATSNYLKAALRIEELRRSWRHTLASAILCRELAQAASFAPERGYTLGLLHDIGRLGLLVSYPDQYAEMLREADREPQSLLDLEKRRFGIDHCEAGRALAVEWKLPDDFPLVLGRHHDPPSGTELDLLGVVYHGCRLADALGFSVLKPLRPPTCEDVKAALPEAVAGRFTAAPEELAGMVEEKIRLYDSGETAAAVILPAVSGSAEESPAEPIFRPIDAPFASDALVAASAAGAVLLVLTALAYIASR